MIAVIADDFTGAAEIGGLGLRYGLTVEIETKVIPNSEADILVIATDTRSRTADEAFNEVFKITKELTKIGVEWIYKKTDSVLRGHVLHELIAQLEASNKNKVLLVPANPLLGRTIFNGIYYIDKIPLHETGFSNDPEYALKSSNVIELLGTSEKVTTQIISKNDNIPENGIIIGEAVNNNDLAIWAQRTDGDIIPAGAAGFFSALLEQKGFSINMSSNQRTKSFGKKALYICGSAFSSSREAINNIRNGKDYVCDMPDEVFNSVKDGESSFQNWIDQVISAINKFDKAVVSIKQPIISNSKFAVKLRESTAYLVENVLDTINIDELVIEGGATASSVLHRVNLIRFRPLQEFAPGVIRMKVEDKPNLYLTMKPGSYSWPKEIWKFN